MTWTGRAGLLAVGVALVVVIGCSQPSGGPSVPWADYAPTLQKDLDALGVAKDCPALQQQFDNADANNDATMTRTGHNNADLMAYIDALMRKAGCY